MSGQENGAATACGYPQSIYIWSPRGEVCSFFPISELLEVIRILKCEELSLCIKLGTSGRRTAPDMLRGGMGHRSFHPDRLLGTPWTPLGVGCIPLRPPGGLKVVVKGGGSSPGPLRSQDIFMLFQL